MPIKITRDPKLLNEDDIHTIEAELGMGLPDDYRDFLLQYNGGDPEPNVFAVSGEVKCASVNLFYGVRDSAQRDDLLTARHRMLERMPGHMIPIGDLSCGNLMCVSLARRDYGYVYFWDHELEAEENEQPSYENLFKIADSFSAFWNGVRESDPGEIELKEEQIEGAWIDPDFLKELEDE